MKTVMLRCSKWLGLMISLLCAVLLWLATTPSGLKLTVQLADYWTPGQLNVQGLRGRLITGFSAERIDYTNQTLSVKLAQFHFSWAPKALLQKTVHIETISAQSIHIHAHGTHNTPRSKLAEPSLTPPISVVLDKLRISSLHYDNWTVNAIRMNGLVWQQQALKATAQAVFKRHNSELDLNGDPNHFHLTGHIEGPQGKAHLRLARHYHWWRLQSLSLQSKFGQVQASGLFNWDRFNWKLTMKGRGLTLAQRRAISFTKGQFQINASGHGAIWSTRVTGIKGRLSGYSLRGHIKANGSNQRLKYLNARLKSHQAQLVVTGHQWPNWAMRWRFEVPRLSRFNADWAGAIHSDGRITGSYNSPTLKGQIALQELLVNDHALGKHRVSFQGHRSPKGQYRLTAQDQGHFPDLGVQLDPATLHIQGINGQWAAQAMLKTGTNPLHLEAKTQDKRHIKAVIHGQKVLLADTHEYRVYATPDLKIDYGESGLSVQGAVTLPQARIRYSGSGDITTMPGDVVYVADDAQSKVTQQQSKTDKAHALPVHLDIQLRLGDAININAMGLKGQATGAVHIKQSPDRPEGSTGAIHLKNAHYAAYGQKLSIKPGEIVYQQSPLFNPNLNAQAVREVKIPASQANEVYNAQIPANVITASRHVTVGVSISGTAQSPSIDLFSKPAGYSDTDILALLLTGSPASAIQKSAQTTALMEAAQLIKNQTGSRIGSLPGQLVDSFSLTQLGSPSANGEQARGVDNTALMIGKYLRPNLFISYSMGLSNDVSQFKVRYELGHHWEVQTEASPIGAGIDVFYTIEH